MKKSNFNTIKKTVLTAVLSAVALVLFFIEFPLLPSSFLKMDFSDVIAVIGGVIIGPWYAVLIELIKNVLGMLLKGLGSTMGFGNLSNFIVGIAYAVPFSIVARNAVSKNVEKSLKLKNTFTASVIGSGTMLFVGYFINLLVTPLYFRFFIGTVLEKGYVIGYAATATAFNAIKAVIMSAVLCIILPICAERLKKTVD